MAVRRHSPPPRPGGAQQPARCRRAHSPLRSSPSRRARPGEYGSGAPSQARTLRTRWQPPTTRSSSVGLRTASAAGEPEAANATRCSDVAEHLQSVVFDLDGSSSTTALRRGPVPLRSSRTSGCRLCAGPGAVAAAEDEHFERWRSGEIGFAEQRRERLRTVLPALGHPLDLDDTAALDDLFADYLRRYRAAWRAFPGERDLLDDLRSRGYRLGLLTNGDAEQQRQARGPGSARPSTSSTRRGGRACRSRTSGLQRDRARLGFARPHACSWGRPERGRRRCPSGRDAGAARRPRGHRAGRRAGGVSAPGAGPPRTVRGVTDSLLHTLVGVLLLVAVAMAVLLATRAEAPWAPAVAILRGAAQLAVISLVLSGIIRSPS